MQYSFILHETGGSRALSDDQNKSKCQSLGSEGVILNDSENYYLLNHFLMLVVGKPGSGKTSIIRRMLIDNNFYKGKFDKVLLVSPSFEKMDIQLPRKSMTSVFDLGWIYSQILDINFEQFKMLERLTGEKEMYQLMLFAQQNGVNMGNLGEEMKQYMITPERKVEHAMYSFKRYKVETGGGGIGLFGDMVWHHPNMGGRYKKKEDFMSGGGGNSKAMRDEVVRNKKVAGKRGRGRGGVSSVFKAGDGLDMGALTSYNMSTEEGRHYLLEFISMLQHKVGEVCKTHPNIRTSHTKNVLIILDDVVGAIKYDEHNNSLAQLFFNRRHLIANGTISLMLVTQKYTMIPARIRSNASWLILFKLNPVDFDNVFKDVIMLTRGRWVDILTLVFGDDSTQLENTEHLELNISSTKRFDNLGVWIERDVLFKNFSRITLT